MEDSNPNSVSLKEYIERILEERDKAIKVAIEAQRNTLTILVVAGAAILAAVVAFILHK
jgi:hypothetical protein